MMSNDDPFAVFGGDEEEETGEDTEAGRIARSLIGGRKVQSVSTRNTTNDNADLGLDGGDAEAHGDLCLEEEEELVLPWPEPLYKGPVRVVSRLPFGGGRGCVATQRLRPGTLVLVEEPLVSWPTGEMMMTVMPDLSLLENLLSGVDCEPFIHHMEYFHPTKQTVDGSVGDVQQVVRMMEMLQSQCMGTSRLDHLIKFCQERGIRNSDGSPVQEKDLLRLCLTLRYNALESGIFLYAAMLNHADQPNCVKFRPTHDQTYSEVRTTRPVAPGEPLTISYVPGILSHATRRRHLWEQHRFDIGAELAPGLRRMELVGGQLPSSSLNRWNPDSTTHRIEKAVEELRDMHREVADAATTSHCADSEFVEQIEAMEQASLELCSEAERQLENDTHLLLLPCRQLHLDGCDLVQRHASLLAGRQRVKLLGRLVASARKLVTLQRLFHGPDHFDLARTNLDLAQAIEELLSKSTRELLSLQLEGINTVSSWSALENTSRKEYNRIKVLYPHDVEEFIGEKANGAE